MANMETAILTGGSQGIATAVVPTFLHRVYNVARHVTGEVPHVDGGAHAGRW
jgi:NAD(P)-dependent dehydrogenase (short-subunit alcohol dehydrogenase family)